MAFTINTCLNVTIKHISLRGGDCLAIDLAVSWNGIQTTDAAVFVRDSIRCFGFGGLYENVIQKKIV